MNAPIVHKLATYLSKQKNNSFRQGLIGSDMGISIFLYQYAKINKDKTFEMVADFFLDYFCIKDDKHIPINFGDGKTGVGWCIEYLVQNGFCEGDTDVLLENVDRDLFKTLNVQKQFTLDLLNGLTGYLMYIVSRLNDKRGSVSTHTEINKSSLRMIINQIDKLMPDYFDIITKDISFDLLWTFPLLLIILKKALGLNIYNSKITNVKLIMI